MKVYRGTMAKADNVIVGVPRMGYCVLLGSTIAIMCPQTM